MWSNISNTRKSVSSDIQTLRSGGNQVRPNTTVDMMDKLGTFAGQQHQDLSPKYREKSLTWVGIEPTTSGLDHRCSTDWATRPDGSRPWEFGKFPDWPNSQGQTGAGRGNLGNSHGLLPSGLVARSVEQRWSTRLSYKARREVVGSIPTQVRDFSLYLGERSWCCWPAKEPNLSIISTVVLGLTWFLSDIYTLLRDNTHWEVGWKNEAQPSFF